ncbi:hypothetical protein BUALT_Bualt03G0085900 [Buddleja alternifolia]|uniref:F-box domain-containing protein n=1 Tax=Buddleja alternifolia TaxID=168488 RepID=A0AAV6XS76_9LAMI|nr:hypothetical protein BUALT_Bualt03G0085900 [Buddleja alternifolia]
MSDIPPEIIREILIWLPVKSLLRFRCVSKPWRSMIDRKDFIKLHLRHSYETNSNRTLVVDSTQLFYVDLDSFEQLDIGNNTQFEPQTVACSCDGLVLIVVSINSIVLWNPATRKLNKLPVTPLEDRITNEAKHIEQRYALGYDSKHDDYKVVMFQVSTRLDGGCSFSETQIYSLRSNTWKRIEDFPYMLPRGKRWGVYLNEALHTVVKDGQGSEVIMAFNIAKEEHYEVPRPSVNYRLSSVEVMGGCLTAIAPGKRNSTEIWAMKEYRVKKSWTKLLCFEPPLREPCLNLCPLSYSKSGDEVLLNYDGICLNWYNLKEKTVSIACVPGLTASFNASAHDPSFHSEFCVGSLVSPYSPAGPGYERQGKKGKEIKKKRDDFLSVGFKLVL